MSQNGVKPQQQDEDPFAVTAIEEPEEEYTHPEAKALFDRCGALHKIPLFGEACQGYGPKATLSLGLNYLLCKGIADELLRSATYPMLNDRYRIENMRIQRIEPVYKMGWSIKALTAALCDAFAFFGYTKRWYLCIVCFGGASFAFVYGFLPAQQSSANFAAGLIFLSSFAKATVDILSEGYYSRLMRKNPKPGPALVSWIWFFITTGVLISSAIQGPLADIQLPQVSVFISGVLQFLTGFIFIFNWYGEKVNREERAEDARRMHIELQKERAALLDVEPVGDAERAKKLSGDDSGDAAGGSDEYALRDDLGVVGADAKNGQNYEDVDECVLPEPLSCCCGVVEFNKEVVVRNWRVFVYAGVMTVSVLSMAFANLFANTTGLLVAAFAVSLVCCGTSFWALPMVIAKANVFGYLQTVCYVSLPGALRPFMQGDADCIADGPHFSYVFYVTVGSIVGSVAGLLGVAVFNYIFSKRSYHVAIISTTIMQIIACVFDFMIVMRWNKKLHIPDKVVFIFGESIIQQVVYMLNWMPSTILISRLCPRGSESIVYALMAGFSNLGGSTSAAIGAILMEYLWPVQAAVKPCDFQHLPKLLAVASLTPLLVIPLCLLLIPNVRICDDIDVNGNAIKKLARKEVAAAAAAQVDASSDTNDKAK